MPISLYSSRICFNPYSGFLSVGTAVCDRIESPTLRFQSLLRFSVRWNDNNHRINNRQCNVSILTQVFCPLELQPLEYLRLSYFVVSILTQVFCPLEQFLCNFSGIGFKLFQSLLRFSVRWNVKLRGNMSQLLNSFQSLLRFSVRWNVDVSTQYS